MGWRYFGRAFANAESPQGVGYCDRCGLCYNLVRLRFQMDWRGQQLTNLQIRVCDVCYDKPQTQLKTIVLPADPIPLTQPRPGNTTAQMNATQLAHWDLSSDTQDPITIILGTWDSGGSVWP